MRETLGFHPLANLFPMIEGQAFLDLVEDVRTKGIRRKVILFEGLILDGRNRYRAGEAADVPVIPLETFTGTYREALDLVISENLHRRHLTDNQRQYVAAKIANMTPGRPSAETPPIGGISVADAAKLLNVAVRGVERAKQIQRDADPALAAAVERGLVPIDMAARASKETSDIQAQVVAAAESGKLKNLGTILKRAERTKREQELAKKQLALPTKKYGVALTDDEWRFEPYSRDTGMDRAPDNHYPTSTLAQLKERNVSGILADDAALWMWATPPMIREALELLQHRGFAYKSMVIWKKTRNGNGRGTGYWFTGEHEILLLGTRGNVPAPAPGTQWPSVIEAPVGEHSAKPDIFYELIEEYFPNIPKIELNARRARRGWDAWGLDAPDGETVDPSTGEITPHLPVAHPECSTLMADPERVAKLADANGMVQIDATHIVAARFVTAGELAQAEAWAAETEALYLRALEIVRDQRNASTSFVQRMLGIGWNRTVALLDRMQAAGIVSAPDDRNKRQVLPPAPSPKTFLRQPQPPEPVVETSATPGRDGPEPIGLFVGKTFVPTTRDPSPAEQFVEQHVPPPPRAADKPELMEIPAFLRREKTEGNQ